MVNITIEAYSDVSKFYTNVLFQYPNEWTQEIVDFHIERTIKEMEQVALKTLNGKPTPILQQINDGNTAEMSTVDKRWYFSVKMVGSDIVIENAWYYANASNRAYRRGISKPLSPLSLDDRKNQKRIGASTSRKKSNNIKILKGTYHNGLKVGCNNNKYIILKSDDTPLVNQWFNAKPKFNNYPYGKLNIIAYVNDNGSLSCLSSDGKLYGMNRSWNDAFTESKKLDSIIRRVIKEEFNPTIPDAEYCVSHQKFDKSCGQKNARTNCKYRRIGKYLIIKGDNQPHRIEGLEQYGKNLYDKTMYTAPDETICVFSVGEGTNKRICCRLEYDESTRMWLGFTPLEAKDVPVLIRQHIKDKSLNRW